MTETTTTISSSNTSSIPSNSDQETKEIIDQLSFSTNSVKEFKITLKKINGLLKKMHVLEAERCLRLSIKNNELILEVLEPTIGLYKVFFPIDVDKEHSDDTGKVKKYIYPETLSRIIKFIPDNTIQCKFEIGEELTLDLGNFGTQAESIYTDTVFPKVGFLRKQEWEPLFSVSPDFYKNLKTCHEASHQDYLKIKIDFEKKVYYFNALGFSTLVSICKDLESDFISKYGKLYDFYIPKTVAKHLISFQDSQNVQVFVSNLNSQTYRILSGEYDFIYNVGAYINNRLRFQDYELLVDSRNKYHASIEVPSKDLADAIKFQGYSVEEYKCISLKVKQNDRGYYLEIKGPKSKKEAQIDIIAKFGNFMDCELQKALLDKHLNIVTKNDTITKISQLKTDGIYLEKENIENLNNEQSLSSTTSSIDSNKQIDNLVNNEHYDEDQESEGFDFIMDDDEDFLIDDNDEDESDGNMFHVLFSLVTAPQEGAPTVVVSNSLSY